MEEMHQLWSAVPSLELSEPVESHSRNVLSRYLAVARIPGSDSVALSCCQNKHAHIQRLHLLGRYSRYHPRAFILAVLVLTYGHNSWEIHAEHDGGNTMRSDNPRVRLVVISVDRWCLSEICVDSQLLKNLTYRLLDGQLTIQNDQNNMNVVPSGQLALRKKTYDSGNASEWYLPTTLCYYHLIIRDNSQYIIFYWLLASLGPDVYRKWKWLTLEHSDKRNLRTFPFISYLTVRCESLPLRSD